MLPDCGYIFFHQVLKQLNSEFYLAFSSMIEIEEMEGVHEVGKAVNHLVVLFMRKHAHEHF